MVLSPLQKLVFPKTINISLLLNFKCKGSYVYVQDIFKNRNLVSVSFCWSQISLLEIIFINVQKLFKKNINRELWEEPLLSWKQLFLQFMLFEKLVIFIDERGETFSRNIFHAFGLNKQREVMEIKLKIYFNIYFSQKKGN